jgi:hypothetical protein
MHVTQTPANNVKGKLSNQTAGKKRQGKNTFNLAYGQRANNVTGDETDAPESKRNRQEDPLSEIATRASERLDSRIDEIDDNLSERVERAVKRRAHILQEIKAISQLLDAVPLPNAAVQLSNAAVPLSSAELSHAAVQLSSPAIPDAVPLPDVAAQLSNTVVPLSSAELSHAAVQLSSPATLIKLPFPFVGQSLPERFNYDGDHNYWDYMGREKFTELLDAINVLETTAWRGYLFYGTIGYGKSHLLAALACYLIAAGKRVVYIPDCRECAWKPIAYFRAAMLLTWGGPDDSVIRESIMALNTRQAISNFFGRQSNIFFLIDQMNILEVDPSGTDGLNDARKNTIYQWIRECVAPHKYIFSASANNQNRSWVKGKQTSAQPLLVHGGFSAVSPYT